jgi:hypothetical protein
MAAVGGLAGVSRWVGGCGGSVMKLRVAGVVVRRGAHRVVVVIVLRARCALRRGSRFIVMMAVCLCVCVDRVGLDLSVVARKMNED